jgi:hypothetical protein
MSKPRAKTAQRRGAAVAPDRDDSADHRVRADGNVVPGFGIPSTVKSALVATRGHRDEPVRKHSRTVAAEQHVAADDVVARNGCNRNHFAVPDGGVHARPLGAETDHRSCGERFVKQCMKEPGTPHTRFHSIHDLRIFRHACSAFLRRGVIAHYCSRIPLAGWIATLAARD